jgi:hypothetical protein
VIPPGRRAGSVAGRSATRLEAGSGTPLVPAWLDAFLGAAGGGAAVNAAIRAFLAGPAPGPGRRARRDDA